MIAGVGIDSVQVDRIRKAAKRWGRSFLRKLFTDAELKYCFTHANPYPSLAARFAAKEAVLKALDVKAMWKWRDMEVRRARSGRPSLVMTGRAAAFLRRKKVGAFQVSLTHDADRATAVVLAVRA
jgi:holo-[acyl-carrier protein] synthase